MSTHAATVRVFRATAIAVGAALLAAATAAGPLVPSAANAVPADAPRDGLLAEYLFTQTTGSTVANTAGGSLGPATVVNGSDALWTGSSLVLAGGAKGGAGDWVRLPDSLLAGEESATITVETKFDPSMASAWHFLWNIGSEDTSAYWFASLKDTARTAITTGGGGAEVNARGLAPLTPGRWYSVTSVIDGAADIITFYVDGVRAGSTSTALTPGSIAAQTMNTIGRAPYPDPLYKGEVAAFRVYDRALTPEEVTEVSIADAAPHADEMAPAAQAAVDALAPIELDDAHVTLPGSTSAVVTWTSSSPDIVIGADGRSATVTQPEAGSVETTLTATATVRGVPATREIPVTIRPAAAPTDDYGYLMVHFIEDAAGYAEKIYVDISRGDDPEKWDPLNGGRPILASQLGTTGVRDPFLTRNPETGRYYIIATDLRVFGGDGGPASCNTWCHWQTHGSTDLVVWESDDLVNWGEPRTFDTALNSSGTKVADLGMAWAPEALWVDDYYPDGRGAFVMYWSSNVYQDAAHTGPSYQRVLWGATTDFSQETFSFGGDFVNSGASSIDTTMIQNDGTTYRITKDNGLGKGIYMESTTTERWWEPDTSWTILQTEIGAAWTGGHAGGVEGPAVFKSHDDEKWYLYVDVIPSTGYRPMVTTDLDTGWTQLNDPTFSMAPHTKHGGIISLTKAQYDTVRSADATTAVSSDLGSIEIDAGSEPSELDSALPATTDVVLAYERGTASRPVVWKEASVDLDTPGTYPITGTVSTYSANLDTWVGAGGSTAWNAPDRALSSSAAITVNATVVVTAPEGPSFTVLADTRCVAGKVVLVAKTTNTGETPAGIAIDTPYGSKTVQLDAGAAKSLTFASRLASVPAGSIEATSAGGTQTAAFAARTCN
ncbi:LamG-like jellyroll fold domain-containing protein [Agromyces albus]|uniref:LamG-like jellyroll fold domain-containing protein n=1 Tax=Agromyces albus TaxID=205332 RepID=UPI00277FE3B8|nr:LamG-like jellyroll fold domain-containing protein [Agromyces albus]MDQ0574111.1 hypothetical protein [Agromyces albus]